MWNVMGIREWHDSSEMRGYEQSKEKNAFEVLRVQQNKKGVSSLKLLLFRDFHSTMRWEEWTWAIFWRETRRTKTTTSGAMKCWNPYTAMEEADSSSALILEPFKIWEWRRNRKEWVWVDFEIFSHMWSVGEGTRMCSNESYVNTTLSSIWWSNGWSEILHSRLDAYFDGLSPNQSDRNSEKHDSVENQPNSVS